MSPPLISSSGVLLCFFYLCAKRVVVPVIVWPAVAVRAENLFLRKQLAMFVERGVRPRRALRPDKLVLVLLAKLFPWRNALVVVSPRTFVSWQRAIERSFWRWISRANRSSARSAPASRSDPQDRAREPAVELRADRTRRCRAAWRCGRCENGSEVSAGERSATAPRKAGRSDVANVHAKSCKDDRCVRLRRRHDCTLSDSVHLRRDGDRVEEDSAHGGYGPSDRCLDCAATPGSDSGRRRNSISRPRWRRSVQRRVPHLRGAPRCRNHSHTSVHAAGERLLRASHRHTPPRVSRLDHSPLGKSPPQRAPRMGHALQPWTATHGARARCARRASTILPSRLHTGMQCRRMRDWSRVQFSVACTTSTASNAKQRSCCREISASTGAPSSRARSAELSLRSYEARDASHVECPATLSTAAPSARTLVAYA